MPSPETVFSLLLDEKIKITYDPVGSALGIFGDKWKVLIVRDFVEDKGFHKDFLHFERGMANNILVDIILWSDKYHKALAVTRQFIKRAKKRPFAID